MYDVDVDNSMTTNLAERRLADESRQACEHHHDTKGLSVPDSNMLISISEVLETPVSTLLGENVIESKADDLKAISEKLEIINLQLAQRKTTKQKVIHWLLISSCAVIAMISAVLIAIDGPYLGWDYSDPETAVFGVIFHAFEWLFVMSAPILLIGAIFGVLLTRKKG